MGLPIVNVNHVSPEHKYSVLINPWRFWAHVESKRKDPLNLADISDSTLQTVLAVRGRTTDFLPEEIIAKGIATNLDGRMVNTRFNHIGFAECVVEGMKKHPDQSARDHFFSRQLIQETMDYAANGLLHYAGYRKIDGTFQAAVKSLRERESSWMPISVIANNTNPKDTYHASVYPERFWANVFRKKQLDLNKIADPNTLKEYLIECALGTEFTVEEIMREGIASDYMGRPVDEHFSAKDFGKCVVNEMNTNYLPYRSKFFSKEILIEAGVLPAQEQIK